MDKKNLKLQIADHVMEYKENYYRLAYSYVRNPHDALDIIQDSITKALASRETLKNPDTIKTWFYRIVINTALDLLRKQKREVAAAGEILTHYDSGAHDRYQDIDLEAAIQELPAQYRSIIVLRFFEDLKIEEIAEILNENINTVKTRLYNSLAKLRITMED